MFFRRRFGRRRAYRKTGLRKRRGVRKVSKVVKRYVKRAIHKQIENKEILDYWANSTIYTMQGAGTNGGSGTRQLLPLPAQGTAENQRIGNQIRVVRGVLKGHINLKPYDATYNPLTPVMVKIWLFRDIAQNATRNIVGTPGFFDYFFRVNGTTVPMQGNLLDLNLPVDDTQFRVLTTKTIELGATYASSTGAVSTGGYFDNSKMIVPFYFNWGKYCKKVLKFTDGGSYPTNENLYIAVQPVRADGTASGTLQMVEWHAVNFIKFEDA